MDFLTSLKHSLSACGGDTLSCESDALATVLQGLLSILPRGAPSGLLTGHRATKHRMVSVQLLLPGELARSTLGLLSTSYEGAARETSRWSVKVMSGLCKCFFLFVEIWKTFSDQSSEYVSLLCTVLMCGM